MKIKKFVAVFLTFCMFGMNMMPVLAASYKLNVESESAETKYLENDQGYISKKIINSNPENGEVTVELTVSNSKKESNNSYTNTEVLIILPSLNSEAMIQKYTNSLKELVNKLLQNSNIKLGVIQIVGPIDAYTNGSSSDAKIAIPLTNDIETFNSSLNNFGNTTQSYNNVQAAIDLAIKSYSTDVNKILILPDIVPTVTNGTKNEVQYGGWTGLTAEEATRNAVSTRVAKTKTSLLKLKSYNVELLMLRPKDEVYNMTFVNPDNRDEIVAEFDGTEYVNELYGTIENPTYGTAYDSNNTDVYTFISEKVSTEILSQIPVSMKNVTITDYFPKDIKDNFEFSYVTKPTKGTISEKIGDDNTIVYTLDELKGNEAVKISYKLKLKNMSNKNLLNKVISTNEKVVLNYTDSSSIAHEVVLESSPSVKLVKVEEPKKDEETPKEDNKETTVENPNTGLYVSFTVVGLIAFGVAVITFKKKNYFSKI